MPRPIIPTAKSVNAGCWLRVIGFQTYSSPIHVNQSMSIATEHTPLPSSLAGDSDIELRQPKNFAPFPLLIEPAVNVVTYFCNLLPPGFLRSNRISFVGSNPRVSYRGRPLSLACK